MISRFFIERPVLANVLALVFVLIGAVALFQLPVASVRIVVPWLGGGFGSKSYTKMEPITVALARKARRPVRIQNSVDEK